MIKRYNVTVYKVTQFAEINTLAHNEGMARESALAAAQQGLLEFKDSKCDLIALASEDVRKAKS